MTPDNTPASVAVVPPFVREERYIVVKRKHLHPMTEAALRNEMHHLDIGTVECVVVESDWPEYEQVWAMIEARMTGDRLVQETNDGTRLMGEHPND